MTTGKCLSMHINKDGSVPDYIPSEYPRIRPSEDVNVNNHGTKKRDVLNGEKR